MSYRILATAICLLLFAPAELRSHSTMRKPTPADLRGVWVGGTVESALELVRIHLTSPTTGVVTISYLPDSPVRSYFIVGTDLDGFAITFHLQPAGEKDEPIYLKGDFLYSVLQLKMGGADKLRWERNLFLYLEQPFLKRVESLRVQANMLLPPEARIGGA